MANMPAEELIPLLREFPRWEGWRGVTGMLYMRLRKSSPPQVLRDRDPDELRAQVAAWHDGHPHVTVTLPEPATLAPPWPTRT